jgi:ABC-2 type transport system ATP-binding protein
MNRSAIRVQRLSQGYGRNLVLDDVSLEMPCGQTFALLGRNGSGKTTLIRTLLGLMPPRSGTVDVLGLNPARQPLEIRSRIGYLAEDQAMYPWMTTDEMARFLAPFYPSWDASLASSLLDRFGVPRHVRICHLSKGQNIRLGLALALAHRPELVILDDPALGLDPISRKQFNRDVVEHLQAEGATVFYSSHLLYEVEAVADAVAILDQGRIVRAGPTEDLQREVKRVVLSADTLANVPRPEKLLDVRREAESVAVTIDHSDDWIAELHSVGIQFAVEDLSLDEIFEAFVIGNCDTWPTKDSRSREPVLA